MINEQLNPTKEGLTMGEVMKVINKETKGFKILTGAEVNKPSGDEYSVPWLGFYYDEESEEDLGVQTGGDGNWTLRGNGTIATYNITHRSSHLVREWRKYTKETVSIAGGTPYGPPPNLQIWPPGTPALPIITTGSTEEIGTEIIDPIVEPDYTFPSIVSVESNGSWKSGESYDVTVYEAEAYSGYFAGYESDRNTGLLGTGSSSTANFFFNNKTGLVNEDGLTDLFAERVYSNDYYRSFPSVVNDAVDDGVIDSVSVVSSVKVIDTTGDHEPT